MHNITVAFSRCQKYKMTLKLQISGIEEEKKKTNKQTNHKTETSQVIEELCMGGNKDQ